jgi:uncharacterized protein YyaL (SSP411 family)
VTQVKWYMTNHLAKETSPYLLQHAHNPVDWYPWGERALQKAKAEDKPIFLSVGYSACHWCHVMAHESFEDAATAEVMNAHFINIKVDREERPDIDRIYMSAVQALTGRGGWPMSIFLSSDGLPLYGGTYFPPTPRYGMPSFTDILKAVANAWENQREELLTGGKQLTSVIERQMAFSASDKPSHLQTDTITAAYKKLRHDFDPRHGGWGNAPKFPQPMTLEFLLRYHHTTGSPAALQMVTQTLDAMARGGVYDQLGGGFHRYAVDAHWTTPHFEKMLYDNAQLARVYLHAWQVTQKPFYRTIAEETLNYVAREMTSPEGGFYATQDADSEGQEGKFFLWTLAEIRATLGDKADNFIQAYGVTKQGNFEGKTILEFKGDLQDRPSLAQARARLLQIREARVPPNQDTKVLTSWNGLMLAAFAEAARILDSADYGEIAKRNANFLLKELGAPDGRLYHTWKGQARGNGYLEDYAYLIEGLLELYRTTFDAVWYRAARDLADAMITHFSAPDGGFYDTSDDHEVLITRPRESQDNATPSGNSMAALVLQRLAKLSVKPRYTEIAQRSLRAVQPFLTQYPLGFAQWLSAFEHAQASSYEIVIVGDAASLDAQALLAECRGYYPHHTLAVGSNSDIPLLHERQALEGRATAYVCHDTRCLPPTTRQEELNALLKSTSSQ